MLNFLQVTDTLFQNLSWVESLEAIHSNSLMNILFHNRLYSMEVDFLQLYFCKRVERKNRQWICTVRREYMMRMVERVSKNQQRKSFFTSASAEEILHFL